MWQWKQNPDEPEKGYMPKVGSLVLGTDRLWKIKIDKNSQFKTAQNEAEKMLTEVEKVSFEDLLQEKTKWTRPRGRLSRLLKLSTSKYIPE